jgi:hypothetical protein
VNRDDDLRELFESAGVEPTAEERRAILAAAEPILAEHAAAAADAHARHAPPSSVAERLRALLGPRTLAFAAAVALIVAVVLYERGTPSTRSARSAPLQSWAEHLQDEPGRPFPLAPASFGRPY